MRGGKGNARKKEGGCLFVQLDEPTSHIPANSTVLYVQASQFFRVNKGLEEGKGTHIGRKYL